MLVVEGDYFSLYSTVMVAHNISHDTLVEEVSADEENILRVDLNSATGKEAEYVGFR
jgi:DNA polymerase elongation subunit (family B)